MIWIITYIWCLFNHTRFGPEETFHQHGFASYHFALIFLLVVHQFQVFTFSISYLWQNHNLPSTYDFHSYMIRSMEEEFQRIVGVR